MNISDSEGSCHAMTSVTIQISTQSMVPSEPQPDSAGNLNVMEFLPL